METAGTTRADSGGDSTAMVAGGLRRPYAGAAGDSRTEAPERIGRYRLLRELGEGGFGVVYLAEQAEPVRRLVAVKVIKPGMKSREVIARFGLERATLASMEHPHVARVLDAGETDEGLPYFAMEFVRGEPITAYCDRRRLGVRARLELFIPVCMAIQHAHQKGVIHRDIKPSNVLVEEVDGKPFAKVIDFGIAKALSHALSAKELHTEFGQIVGTPEYMSPEQASGGAHAVDTRADVYSLGVVLYELLTGLLPFDPKRLRSLAYAELIRVISEEDPPTPARRVDSSADSARFAAARSASARELVATLRGELGLIPSKAMHKDREMRYRGAADLADDLSRFLQGLPIEAAPDTAAYRLGKFIARRRLPVALTAAMAAAVVAPLAADAGFYVPFAGILSILGAAVCAAALWTACAAMMLVVIGERDRLTIPSARVLGGGAAIASMCLAFIAYTVPRLAPMDLDSSVDEVLAQATRWWWLIVPGVAAQTLLAAWIAGCRLRRAAVAVLALQAILWGGSMTLALAQASSEWSAAQHRATPTDTTRR